MVLKFKKQIDVENVSSLIGDTNTNVLFFINLVFHTYII